MADQKSWWESLLDTVGDLGGTAINAIYGSKTAEAQSELYTGQQIQKEKDSEFWKKFAIVSGAVVGGLVLGKFLKLF